eukprot:3916454-Alexandrium_andersonii.AAC.1
MTGSPPASHEVSSLIPEALILRHAIKGSALAMGVGLQLPQGKGSDTSGLHGAPDHLPQVAVSPQPPRFPSIPATLGKHLSTRENRSI